MIIGADSTDKAGANPFWTFSLALYDHPGVATACIDLQDSRGLDVNLLLFACFAAASGRRLSVQDANVLEHAAADIRESLVMPIRVLRRQASSMLGEGAVKSSLQAAELAAERAQQDAMWAAGATLGLACPSENAADVLRENLEIVGGERLESFAVLVDGLLALSMPQQ